MCLISLSLGYQSGGQSADDGENDEAAYRTWHFLLLAKSGLQRLGGDSVDRASTNNADWSASSNSDDWSATNQDNAGQGSYYSNDDDDRLKKPSGRPCQRYCFPLSFNRRLGTMPSKFWAT